MEVGIDIQKPITENGRIQIDGAISVVLSNTGDSIATVNAHLTIKPCAVFTLSTPSTDVVINDYLTVIFGEGSNHKLEIISMRVKSKAHSNYS